MSQHDFNVANSDGATVRADINSALQAIAECSSGATAPSTTFAYQWWADTANDLLKQRNAANSGWITLFTLSDPSATATQEGISELATAAEINTGTDAGRTITPDALAGSNLGTVRVVLTAIAPATDCAVADDNAHFHVPASMAGMNLVSVHAENITAGATGTGTYQVRNDTSGNNMLSTAITIDSGETGSDTAATAAVINASEDDLTENDLISIDIDGIQTTAAKGLVVTLEFRLP